MNSASFNSAVSGLSVRMIRGQSDAKEIIRSLADGDGMISRCRPMSEEPGAGYCLDLSNLPKLGKETADLSNNNDLMTRVLFVFKKLAEKKGFYFARVDLSNNIISGRSFLQVGLQSLTEKVIELHFNHTLISSNGLYNAKQLIGLRKLSLDYCKKLKSIQSATVSQLPDLEELSAVGSGMIIDPAQIEKIGLKFPKLRKLDCTQKRGSAVKVKLLGVTDPITLSTVINPYVFSCGHIMGAESIPVDGRCYVRCKSVCLESFWPKITRFEKLNERWTVRLLDFQRNDLADGIFYHPCCGNLFNHETLQKILLLEGSAQGLMSLAKERNCPGCSVDPLLSNRSMELIKLFPVLQSPDDLHEPAQQQQSLVAESVYMNIT